MVKLRYINFTNKLKLILVMLLFMSLFSCSSLIRNVLGNTLIDRHYAPELQKHFFYKEVPYAIINGWIVLKAKINNSEKEYNFIFDTGGVSMISENLISEVGLKDGITKVNLDVNENKIFGLTFLTNLQIGTLNISNLRIDTTTSEIFSNSCKGEIDGIIGANILNQGFFYFNTLEKKLIITNQKAMLPISDFDNPIKIKRFMGQPYIVINGYRKEWLKLDTGYADGDIFINEKSEIIDRKKDKLLKQKTYTIKGLSSDVIKTVSFYKRNIKIGNIDFMVLIKQFQRKEGNGNIGSKFFLNNDIIIDIKHNNFYLKNIIQFKNTDTISNINFTYKNNNILIGSLTKESNIEKMGLKVNDTIYKLNNYRLNEIKNECQFIDFINSKKNNFFPLHLEVKKNTRIEKYIISKQDYYD